jgi:hypothetical protein
LKPQQHGAVLLLLVTNQVQFRNCGGESFDDRPAAADTAFCVDAFGNAMTAYGNVL